MTALPIVLVYPEELMNDPRIKDVPSPVSTLHTLINCARCSRSSWIGPTQRTFAEAGKGEVVCFYCLAEDDLWAATT